MASERTASSECQDFAWKPALLRSKRRVQVLSRGFRVDGGETRTWDQIQQLSFALDHSRGGIMMTLRMRLGDSEEVLFVNGSGGELPIYCGMLRALVEELTAARPETKIVLGHVGAARTGMFLVGSAGLITGLALVVFGLILAQERESWSELGMSFVGLVVGSMCLFIATSHLPWRTPPSQPVSEFWKQLEGVESRCVGDTGLTH